jgi:hypothetical protein
MMDVSATTVPLVDSTRMGTGPGSRSLGISAAVKVAVKVSELPPTSKKWLGGSVCAPRQPTRPSGAQRARKFGSARHAPQAGPHERTAGRPSHRRS